MLKNSSVFVFYLGMSQRLIEDIEDNLLTIDIKSICLFVKCEDERVYYIKIHNI